MDLVVAVVALIMAVTNWRLSQGIAHTQLQIMQRLDAVERKKGVTDRHTFEAVIKYPGQRKPTTLTLDASNEGDALRQLLLKKIDPTQVVTLTQKGE